ncbi:hypothetical protein B0H21DRAFT_743825 [Amylocystis lapponica]|nr:hypothetical protein B0H21DRAFT_743825 [Amylocystis lapponica]
MPPLKSLSGAGNRAPLACFSPSVSASVQQAWVAHGGTITQSSARQSEQRAQFYFCNGKQDPWFSRYVFHSSWIVKAAATKFLVPIAKYVLDDRYEVHEPNMPLDQTAHMRPLIGDSDDTVEQQTPMSDRRPYKRARTSTKTNQESEKSQAVSREIGVTVGEAEKSGKVPRVDLRGLAVRPRKNKVFVIRKIPAVNVKNDRNRVKRSDFAKLLLDSASGASNLRVSVVDALYALRDVETSNAVRFRPGSGHLGQEFYCTYTGA